MQGYHPTLNNTLGCCVMHSHCFVALAKGIPSIVPRGYIIDEIAACAVNTIWPNLPLRLNYPNELFSIAKH